jgi:nitrogenase molybdenum-iron protein NifN
MLPYFADELVELGVTHVTVTVNAVNPSIAAKIYREINFMGLRLTGEDGCRILLRNQLAGLRQLVTRGVVCKVNIVMIKGINEDHIEEVVKTVKECGVYMTNIMPLIPAKGSVFEDFQQTSGQELNEMRKRCGRELRQMYHCRQCRADAIGTLGEDIGHEFSCKAGKVQDTSIKIAVATKTGMLVDQHFGHAQEFHIYSSGPEGTLFLEKRKVDKFCDGIDECEGEENDDAPGSEEQRLENIIGTVSDCSAVLVMRIGYNPLKSLQEKGITVVQTCGRIEDGIKNAIESIKVCAS